MWLKDQDNAKCPIYISAFFTCCYFLAVRDATARLPNGEGTRTDICELLKDSQYLAPVSQESYLHSVVSGALDRLHYETDPCVKYDTKRKIWIYLHRGRTEEEFGECNYNKCTPQWKFNWSIVMLMLKFYLGFNVWPVLNFVVWVKAKWHKGMDYIYSGLHRNDNN
jgi:hypothetical protein